MTALRRYAVRARLSDGRLDASIIREGPLNPLAVGVGRPAADAPRLAALLFPLCPHAHRAAAERALEDAAGLTPDPAHDAARAIAVLSEALAAAIWRMGVDWPARRGAPARLEAVKAARDGAAALLAGDAAGRVALAHALAAVEEEAAPILAHARGLHLRGPGDACSPAEETPRLLDDPGGFAAATATDLSPWFTAQARHARMLSRELDAACAAHDRKRRGAAASSTAICDAVDATSVTGAGAAMTARGRVRHMITLEAGRIMSWRAIAPTDVNFAPQGPLAHWARRLIATADPADALAWLVAAFDPCAPCAIAIDPTPRAADAPTRETLDA